MMRQLLDWAESRGVRAGWGPSGVLGAVRADIERRRAAGELSEAFAREHLAFDFGHRQAPAGEWRLLLIVMPRPAHGVTFTVGGRHVEAILPPTYAGYRALFERVRRDLLAGPLAGAKVETLDAPLKPIAARLGLVRYGRNNLTYAAGIGSYLQLLGYLTDAPLPIPPDWRMEEPALLDECEACALCEALCPTGAIEGDRVLLHAERCLTLANEGGGRWPAWVPAAAHHCLVGCLGCQRLCPANPPLATDDSGVVFSEDETNALLANGERTGPAWTRIRKKLEALGQEHHEHAMGRNLQALLRTVEGRRGPENPRRRVG